MKKIILLVFTMASISTFAQDSKPNVGIGRVQKIQSKEVYLFSEPERAYDVVFEYNNSLGTIGRPNINEFVFFSVKNAVNYGKKKNIDFDAVIINSAKNYTPLDSKKDIAIKFKN